MSGTVRDCVLIVDDEDIDAMIVERTLRRLNPELRLLRAENGAAALAILESRVPDLVIMDIRMPGMDGREALEIIKADPVWRTIPVVMMSTSRSQSDIDFCYSHFANAYLPKLGMKEGRSAIETMARFWLEMVESPRSAGCL